MTVQESELFSVKQSLEGGHERQSAAHYKANFEVIPESAHNIMMEYNYRGTAELIHHWLEKHGIN